MKCPYCDSILEDSLRMPTCPRCGGILPEQENCSKQQGLVFPDPPIGRYRCCYGYMELGEEAVVFHKKVLLQKQTHRVIPYDQIYGVTFKKATGVFDLGGLCVREKKDRYLPFATDSSFSIDETSIEIGIHENEEIYSVFTFLMECADLANKET